jgi:hypothetical protein
MPYSLLAGLVVCAHIAFVLFVVFGGFFALKWRAVMWWHLPAALWAAVVELTGWVCPLTPLENRLREQAGLQGYRSDFVAQYLFPFLYPEHLTREIQILLGIGVIAVNLILYGWLWRHNR